MPRRHGPYVLLEDHFFPAARRRPRRFRRGLRASSLLLVLGRQLRHGDGLRPATTRDEREQQTEQQHSDTAAQVRQAVRPGEGERSSTGRLGDGRRGRGRRGGRRLLPAGRPPPGGPGGAGAGPRAVPPPPPVNGTGTMSVVAVELLSAASVSGRPGSTIAVFASVFSVNVLSSSARTMKLAL